MFNVVEEEPPATDTLNVIFKPSKYAKDDVLTPSLVLPLPIVPVHTPADPDNVMLWTKALSTVSPVYHDSYAIYLTPIIIKILSIISINLAL